MGVSPIDSSGLELHIGDVKINQVLKTIIVHLVFYQTMENLVQKSEDGYQ